MLPTVVAFVLFGRDIVAKVASDATDGLLRRGALKGTYHGERRCQFYLSSEGAILYQDRWTTKEGA
jgi:hypothetical protein